MVDTIVVMSRWQQDLLANNGIALEKIRLIRHGIPNTNEPLPKSEPEIVRRTSPLRIGFVGRLTPLKGPHVLVKALRSLPRSISLEVNIYGNVQSEQDSEYLVRLQAAAHRDGRIRFHGELEFGKKAAAFNSLDILAIPSVSFETGPLVLLEAHNAGLPVLASRIGTIEEMIRDGVDGLLVKPGDIPAWASAIRHLFELWRDDRWNWDIPKVKNMGLVSKEMDRIYAALLNRKFEN
jgi:glycosyltransferase involved in cell wall biosynthesis